jgi:hypothetical protein
MLIFSTLSYATVIDFEIFSGD